MLKVLIGLILAAAALPLRAAELRFVESVPEETVYGSTLAARPQPVWLEMIGSAGKTLDLDQFYISDEKGKAMEPVLDALKAAAKRGVKVRLVLEKAMMRESAASVPGLKEAGVRVRVINFKKLKGGVQHSKFFIVDGAEAYVGSQNFDWRSLTQIHELGVVIKSTAAAADLTTVFDGDWAAAGGTPLRKAFGRRRVRLNAAHPEEAFVNGGEVLYSLAFSPVGFLPKGAESEVDAMVRLLDRAKHVIHGQVMTYALSEYGSKRWAELDTALRKAAARGVKVELVISDWGMGGKADRDIKALAKTDNISIKISSLPQLSGGFIPYARVEHLKYMVVDGRYGYVTTSNWGPGYFLTSRGAAVVTDGAPAAEVLEDVFSKAWNGPYVQPVDPLKEYGRVRTH